MTTVLLIIVAVIAALLIYAATRPNDFRIERAATIEAPPEAIFPLIADFHQWRQWSPWENRDPALKRTYSGAPNGKGAIYAWEGNKNVGSGRMEILDAPAPQKITIKLDFLKPFEAHNTAEFTLQPQGASTRVSWAMTGAKPYMMKLMGVFMNMDEMVGKDFVAGLTNLRQAAEK
ncbi:SRPBCC family protein [Terrarubrum flagellatum]|uniref:SRPBCC family protein n=1 Tax=Terrirubrum flagellatum TaxID=2895980 RepID=UPI0031454C69